LKNRLEQEGDIPFKLLEGSDRIGGLSPITKDELDISANALYEYRLRNESDFIRLEDYLELSHEYSYTEEGLAIIPPLDGSISYGPLDVRAVGCAYPYVFMSKSIEIVSVSLAYYKEDAALRSIGILDENNKPLYRYFFVGFFDINEASSFHDHIAWEETVEEEVFFNGHKLICGADNFKEYGVV